MDTLPTLDELVSSVMLETPSYQLPDGEVVHLREEYWIKPLVDINECEFVKDMFGLIWEPVEVIGWTEIDGVYILDEHIGTSHTPAEGVAFTQVRNITSETMTVGTLVEIDQVYRINGEWIPLPPGESGVMDVYPMMAAWATIMYTNAAQVIAIDDTDDFPEAVCPICGKATCDHYDDHEPMFKSCQTIGG